MKRVCLVSSGTGGHLWPALVLGEALVDAGHETLLVTEGREAERDLLERVGASSEILSVHGRGLMQVSRLWRGTLRARRLLRERKVDFVVSTGGRTSLAVGMAAKSLGMPLFLLEQNAVAGRANRFLLPMAKRIYLGLPPRRQVPRALVTGTPLRREFRAAERGVARASLGLDPDRLTVLVTGGSQGAGALNDCVPAALWEGGAGAKIQVVHLSGPGHDAGVRGRYRAGLDTGVHAIVRAMAVDMANLYAAADLVICRGGGCTVAELIAIGRPAIIVPYPHHKDRQQFFNGSVLADVGAAVVIEQPELTVETMRATVRQLLASPADLARMGNAARALAPRDPCAAILDDVQSSLN